MTPFLSPLDTWSSVGALAPELSLALTASAIVLLDAFWRGGLGRNALLGLATLGLSISALLAVPLLGVNTSAFGGALAVDGFAIFFKLLLAGATMLVLFASTELLDDTARHRAEYVGLLLFCTGALMLLAAAGDLLMAYIALETSGLSIALLAAWNKRDVRSTEAGLKFFLLSAMASAILLYGMALIYGLTGQLGLEAIGREIAGAPSPSLLLALAMLLAGVGFKISAVPFQMWTPDVYQGAPTPVTAYLSVASKAAGFAVLLRVLVVALPSIQADWSALVAVLALATMTVGNVLALVQSSVKRMLAYSSIAQAGYVLVGVAAASAPGTATDRAVAAVLFYLLGYTVTNLAAFGAVTIAERVTGSDQIASLRGLVERAPGVSFAFAIGLLSLAGLPPFVGFFGKFYVFWAAAQSGLLWLVLAGLINSAISLYYYAQVIHDMYLASLPDEVATERLVQMPSAHRFSLAVASLGVVLFGVLSGLFFGLQEVAAVTLSR